MTSGTPRILWVLCALVSCLCATPASAHAPLPRALAVSPSGHAVSLALPGFGLLIRSGAGRDFAYACDALLGVPPSDLPVALAYFDDDTLLVGSPAGLRRIAANGCPLDALDPVLEMTPVVALAIHPATQVAYLIASGYSAGVWRSMDRGIHWEHRGPVAEPDRVTGFVIDPGDPTQLFVTRSEGEVSTLLVSTDAGSSFTSYPQARALRMLAVQAEPQRLWAVARATDSVGNRGFSILRAPDVQSTWSDALRVHYFGGLAIAANGEIWVGDEGGGVYRSTDSGDTFTEVDTHTRAACMASTTESVLACTPGLPEAPALQALSGATATAQPIVAFTDVSRLVECGTELAQTRCQAAWVEWQRDVLMRDLTSADSGPVQSGAASPPADAALPTLEEAPDAADEPARIHRSGGGGCSVAREPRATRVPGVVEMLACAALAWMLRRRIRGWGHCVSQATYKARWAHNSQEDDRAQQTQEGKPATRAACGGEYSSARSVAATADRRARRDQ